MISRAALPRDGNQVPIQGTPPAIAALEETYDASVSASTEVTLNAATTMVEVTAIDKGLFLKWGTTDVSSTDFDAFIPANTSKLLPVPATATARSYDALNVIEEAASSHAVIIEY